MCVIPAPTSDARQLERPGGQWRPLYRADCAFAPPLGRVCLTCRTTGRRSEPRCSTRRPGPEEVVATHRTERVEYLAADVESRMSSAFHRARMYLPEIHPAARHLGLLVSLITTPRQRASDQHRDQTKTFIASQLRERTRRVHFRERQQHRNE